MALELERRELRSEGEASIQLCPEHARKREGLQHSDGGTERTMRLEYNEQERATQVRMGRPNNGEPFGSQIGIGNFFKCNGY